MCGQGRVYACVRVYRTAERDERRIARGAEAPSDWRERAGERRGGGLPRPDGVGFRWFLVLPRIGLPRSVDGPGGSWYTVPHGTTRAAPMAAPHPQGSPKWHVKDFSRSARHATPGRTRRARGAAATERQRSRSSYPPRALRLSYNRDGKPRDGSLSDCTRPYENGYSLALLEGRRIIDLKRHRRPRGNDQRDRRAHVAAVSVYGRGIMFRSRLVRAQAARHMPSVVVAGQLTCAPCRSAPRTTRTSWRPRRRKV